MRQAIFQNDRLVATGESVVVQVDQETRRSRPFPPATMERIAGLMKPE